MGAFKRIHPLLPAPLRRCRCETAAVAQERVSKLDCGTQSGWGRRRHRFQPPKGVEESPPASSASVKARQRLCYARVSWNGPGRGRQPPESWVLQAQTELTRLSAEVVEGEQRLATLRAELERPQSLVVAVDMSAEVERLRVLVEQLSNEKEDGRPHTYPNLKRVCRREDFVPQCDEEMQEWIEGRQRDLQAAIVAGQLQEVSRVSNSCPQQRRSGNILSRNSLRQCRPKWRTL